jgi:cysteine desulfurase family protein (TIGR01976 family)
MHAYSNLPSTLDTVRAQFPSLAVIDDGKPRIYFDNPAGTQVTAKAVSRMQDYLLNATANSAGCFRTSLATTNLVVEAREKMQAFLNAHSADEIVFGPNMTSLTFHLTRALEPLLSPGDEILLTRMDHDGNVTPWTLLAERCGLSIKWLEFDRESCQYNLEQLERLLTPRTRLVAVNHASNITGTINNVAEIAKHARACGALSYVDSVQFAPHGDVDVQDLGCDFLVCSAYKFYGPHVGILWGKKSVLDALSPPKLRAAPDTTPRNFETGCANYEGLAALIGTVEYYEWLGRQHSPEQDARTLINNAKSWMRMHEDALAVRLLQGLSSMPKVRVHGIADEALIHNRVSTISVSVAGHHPLALATALAEHNIFTWSGHNYALQVIDSLGLADSGGVLRLGPVHYNTAAEVDHVLERLERIIT